jgi:hypothetical protein
MKIRIGRYRVAIAIQLPHDFQQGVSTAIVPDVLGDAEDFIECFGWFAGFADGGETGRPQESRLLEAIPEMLHWLAHTGRLASVKTAETPSAAPVSRRRDWSAESSCDASGGVSCVSGVWPDMAGLDNRLDAVPF